MARSVSKKSRKPARGRRGRQGPGLLGRLWRWSLRGILAAILVFVLIVLALGTIQPPQTPYMRAEARRLGGIEAYWVDLDQVSPVMARAAVAAEDADFCTHYGFDVDAIRAALADGATRGGSTITQQVVKNVFLWQGRSWTRKVLEAAITPLVETLWSKRRILEVYLNIAETGPGRFGVEAAARHEFGINAAHLDADQAARIAVTLPNPKQRSASNLSPTLRKRAVRVADGAATIAADGRSGCFEAPAGR
ncbi:MAG: monofunctional biosynthetic peptidoglycan transglycosylase [Marinibacterium sp.]